MSDLGWIGAGGCLGSIARFSVGAFVQSSLGGERFPYGTLAVNVVGCLAIGILAERLESRDARAFWVIGFLGGFTTFSAFGNETLELARGAEPWLAAVYVGASVVLGLAAVLLGRTIALSG
ncbi:MAG: fluoride efflux transporter CrcB [Candidatus Binatia bacterium]